jgi:type IV secretory pathway protease TraF
LPRRPARHIYGIAARAARERDRRGPALLRWDGCRVIAEDQVFLMNPDELASLDGRYFGPIPSFAILSEPSRY